MPARGRTPRAIWVWGAALVGLATAARLIWVLSVPTVPVSDFAMYRESANYLSEFGRLDPGFIYMPGFVALLAAIKNLGGDLLAQKLLGVFFGALGAAGLFVVTWKLVDEAVVDATAIATATATPRPRRPAGAGSAPRPTLRWRPSSTRSGRRGWRCRASSAPTYRRRR